jgi:hypothetical protein
LKEKIASDSTVADLVDSLANPIEYVRQIIGNFVAGQYDRDTAVVRIGVEGVGVASNYKIEYPQSIDVQTFQRSSCPRKTCLSCVTLSKSTREA